MYEKDGITYPRCTEVIKDCSNNSDALIQWAANQTVEWIRENAAPIEGGYWIPDENLDKARFNFRETSQIALDVGSEVHAAIEAHLTGLQVSLTSEQAKSAFAAFLEWKEGVELEPIALEKSVFGKTWAGTMDFYGKYKGKLYVIDWKTSKAFYMTEMGAQIAAYRSCIPEAEGCGILRLDKETGMPEFKDFSKRYERDLGVFNKMVELYILKHPRIAKRFEGREQ